jgi:hypothetical protein
VRARRLLIVGALALLAPAASAGASSDATGLGVSAWPARLVVPAPGEAVVGVGNPADEPVALIARPLAYALDARGRPRVEPARRQWFTVRPARLVIRPHGLARLQVTVRKPSGARPGDHAELLLLSTQPPAGRRIVARLRIGVVVVVRVPGKLVHRLRPERVRARRQGARTTVEVTVANRGNVDEWLGRGRVVVSVAGRSGRLVGLPREGRRLLARSTGIVEVRFRRRLRGSVAIVVTVMHPREGVTAERRRWRLRL